MYMLCTLVCLLGVSCCPGLAEASVAACTPQTLDVHVLPPLEPNTASELHILVIEVENRGQSPCQLQNFGVALVPQSGADSFTNGFFRDQEKTPTERKFAEAQNLLSPGQTGHVLVAWYSRASFQSGQCVNRDGLTLSLGMNQPALLSIDHLWMRICDRVYVSGVRAGHYDGEAVPTEWLNRLGASPADFAPPPFVDPMNGKEALIATGIEYERVMLDDYFPLFLELPNPDLNCPFIVLRKREADGATKAYINHCNAAPLEKPKPHVKQTKWVTWLGPSHLGLQPERTGIVEYEVISGIRQNDTLLYAEAHTSIVVRSPKSPTPPLIDSPFPECRATQLKAADPTVINGGKWHEAHVYELMNISGEPCRVGGVPQLSFPHPSGRSFSSIPVACPNCADPLFEPRPSGWIDLRPGKAAHFLVGSTRFNTDTGRWRQICDIEAQVELKLRPENKSMLLPFGAGACGGLTVSAWRDGKFDSDPKNVAYNRRDTNRPEFPLSLNCAKADFSKVGRPMMLAPQGGLQFGLSVGPARMTYGSPAMLHLWIDNQTNEEASVMTCETLDFFWTQGFDLYDAYGHRLVKKSEQENGTQKTTSPDGRPYIVCLGGWECGRNILIPIAAHNCTNGDNYQLPYDFNRDLLSYYDLPPGTYYVVPRTSKLDQSLCREIVPQLDPAVLRDKLRIVIEQD
jgi:hypothetical protein